MTYKIETTNGRTIECDTKDAVIRHLVTEWPDCVAYDEAGFPWDRDEDVGGRVLVWADEVSSFDDDGANAVAKVCHA